jgi:hypothetical protein
MTVDTLKAISAAVVFAMIAGCASVTPVTPAGKDTYYISAVSGVKPSAKLKSVIYVKADAYCRVTGKEFSPEHESHGDGGYHMLNTAELTFRCFDRDSSDYQPPHMTPVPNVRIENR